MVGVDCIVHDKWKIVELIAQGGFGSIFKGVCSFCCTNLSELTT